MNPIEDMHQDLLNTLEEILSEQRRTNDILESIENILKRIREK